jgi:hypothetical protein
MFGKMMAAALKGPAPAPDMSGFKDGAPSWGELAALLASQQTEAERALPDLRAAGRGPTSSKAALRLFDAPDGYEPRVTLYRDTASWCTWAVAVATGGLGGEGGDGMLLSWRVGWLID